VWDTFLSELEMDKLKEQQILDLIENRLDLDYVKIALFTASNLTAVAKVAKDNHCQRKRGRRPWKRRAVNE